MVRAVLSVAALAVGLAACASTQIRDRIAACEAQKFRTAVERAQCFNDAEAGLPYSALRASRHNTRLALAARVDAREITQVEADRLYAAHVAQSAEDQRRAGTAAMVGAMIGSGVR